MGLKSFATLLMQVYISNTLGLDQTYFTQSNVPSLQYNVIHKNYTTRSAISCIVSCKTFAQTCTHAVLKDLDDNIIQCSLIDAVNGTTSLAIAEDGSRLWTKGKKRTIIPMLFENWLNGIQNHQKNRKPP